METFAFAIQEVMKTEEDFSQKIKRRIPQYSSYVKNPYNFIAELLHEDVLSNESTDPEASFELRELMIQCAMKIACCKGPHAVRGLIKALEASGNIRLIKSLRTWTEKELGVETDNEFSEPNQGSALEAPPRKKLRKSVGRTATGIFLATSQGLIALDLQTSETRTVAPEEIHSVAVYHKLNKVYWVEVYGGRFRDSRVLRSNFDGSDREIIVPWTGKYILTLAIDEATGDVYFTLSDSKEITVCRALDNKCVPVISGSPLVSDPSDIAIDSKNGFMFWTNALATSIVRCNLYGHDATKISKANEFDCLSSIALEQLSNTNDVLYWFDSETNTIGTIGVNGGRKRVLVELEDGRTPWAIQVDDNRIYFSDMENIRSVDKCSGQDLTTIPGYNGSAYDLALIYTPSRNS